MKTWKIKSHPSLPLDRRLWRSGLRAGLYIGGALWMAGCQTPARQSQAFRQSVETRHSSGSGSATETDSAIRATRIGISTPLEAFPMRELSAVDDLTLTEAANRTLGRNPKWRMGIENAMRRNANAYQNQLLPNPAVNMQWENLFGSGAFAGDQQVERTLQLSQSVPIGGRISASREVTQQMKETTFQELEALRLEVLSELGQAFVGAYAAQLRLDLSQQSVELTQQIEEAVQAQLQSGKVSPVELAQAQTQLSLAKAQNETALRQWISAKANLGKLWNEPVNSPTYKRLSADWNTFPTSLETEINWAKLQDHPRTRWMEERLELAHKQLIATRRAAYPDINLQAAYRELEGPDEEVYVFGFTVPIPLFDRTQGAIEAAIRNEAEAKTQLEGTLFEMEINSKAALSQLESSWRAVKFLKEEAVPSADQALSGSREGYKSGKLTYIETLNAQQAWIQTQLQMISATEALHIAVVQLETQMNTPLSSLLLGTE